MYRVDKLPAKLEIGCVGETNFRKIEIDLAPWLLEYPTGVPSMRYVKPGKTNVDAYTVATVYMGGVISWTPTSDDIGDKEGFGSLQIILEITTENSEVSVIGKSTVVQTVVKKGIEVDGTVYNLDNIEELIDYLTDRTEAAEAMAGTAITRVQAEQTRATAAENTKVAKADIANDLTTTAEGKVLDARQGKELKDQLDNKVGLLDVVNNCTTTEEGKALDARQGKVLMDGKIDKPSGIVPGKYLQTDLSGVEVWGDAASPADVISATEAWLANHVNTNEFAVDNTLLIAGDAADSKTTGEAISTVMSAVQTEATARTNADNDLKSAFVNELNGNLPYFLIKNEYVKTNGDFEPYTGWARTDYIPLKGIDSITVKSSVASGYNSFYKEDKSFLSALNVTTIETKIMIPQLARYVAFSNIAAGMESFDATFAETQSKEIEILEKTADDLEQEYMPFKLVQREYVDLNGEIVQAIAYARTGYLFVGDVSIIAVNSQGNSNYNAFYTKEKDFIKTFSVPSGEKEIEIPENAFYIVMSNEYEKMLGLTIRVLESRERYFDYDFVTNEYINPDDGSFTSYSGWSRTELIPVNKFKGIRVKSSVNSAYNAFFKKNRTVLSQFNVKTTETCIAIPEDAYYVAFSNTNAGMKNFTVSFAENGIYSYPDVLKTVYSYDNNFIYSVKDGIISFDGSITGTTFRIDLPNIVLDGYSILNVETVEGDYTGEVFILLLPTTSPAYILSVKGHITRLNHFTNEERGIAIYVPSNTTFSGLKFRVWITPGLINEPFIKQTEKAIGLSAGEYNAPEYPRIGDKCLYNVFGNNFAACKDGMMSRINADRTIKFGLLADLHYTDHEDFYKRIYQKLSDAHVDFCLMLGDIIDRGYFSYPELCAQQMAQFKNSVQYLLAPNFPFCGNHDDDVSAFAHHGVIDYGNIRFVYFWADYEGESGGGTMYQSEIDWVEEQLQQSKAKHNILMCHYAVSTDPGFGWYLVDPATREAIEDLAEEYNVKLFLNGHEHDESITVGDAGVMKDINLPNGQFAYCICTIDNQGEFVATVYDSETDAIIKTITLSLN